MSCVQSPGLLCPLAWSLLGRCLLPQWILMQEEWFWLLYNKEKHSERRLLDTGWSLGQR